MAIVIMTLADVFFTPSILITLAICLILISALGLFFIQKLNQQNHKLNTMFDLVSTLAQQVNSLGSGGSAPHSSAQMGGVGATTMPNMRQEDNSVTSPANEVYDNDASNTHTISMINVSDDDVDSDDDEDSDDEDSDDEDSDDEDSDDEGSDDGGSDDEDSDDEGGDDEDKNASNSFSGSNEALSSIDDDIEEIGIDDLEATSVLGESEDLSSMVGGHEPLEKDIMSLDDPSIPTNTKSLDIVIDYKKTSISKLREIVENKGIVDDASKLKKNELLKLLDV